MGDLMGKVNAVWGSLVSLALFVSSAHARSACSELLTSKVETANSFEFAVSDLEGLYLNLIQAAWDVQQDAVKAPVRLENLLKEKAEFLNDMMAVAGSMQNSKSVNLQELQLMLVSLNVDAKSFGFDFDKNGKTTFALPIRPHEENAPLTQDPITIGFRASSTVDESPQEILQRRSIGFGELELVPPQVPARRGGQISFLPLTQQGILVVRDLEKNVSYAAPINVLATNSAETLEKSFTLAFDPDRGAWLVRFKNLANPTGKIGF
jgi:hypothetical protein